MKKLFILGAAALGLASVSSPTPSTTAPSSAPTTATKQAPSKKQTPKQAEPKAQAPAPVQRGYHRKPRRRTGGMVHNVPRRCRYGKHRWIMLG